MRLAVPTVPKKNPAESCGNGAEAGGLCFISAEEGGRRMLARTNSLLVVTDGGAFDFVAPLAVHPHVVSVVLDGADSLPLFTMPDTCAVFAAGGRDVIAAARFFAAVRRLPCAVAPSDASCIGVYETHRLVRVGEERTDAPLSSAEVYLDLALMRPSLADAVGEIALARLAEFEGRVIALFGGECRQSAFPRLPVEGSAEEIVRANVWLRRDAPESFRAGEGTVLAESYGSSLLPAWRAFCELSALYAAFFRFGVPRKYCVPDYAARRIRAGTACAEVCSPELYAKRAVALDMHRAELRRAIGCILRDKPAYARSVSALFGRLPEVRLSDALRMLPERAPGGLSAIIRDFGLFEDL